MGCRGPASAPGSRVAADVVKTDENLMIARHARALIADSGC
jgi:acetate kinase